MFATVIIVERVIMIKHILSIIIITFITLNFVLMSLYFCCYIMLDKCYFGWQLEIAHPNYRSGFSTSEWQFGVVVYAISIFCH